MSSRPAAVPQVRGQGAGLASAAIIAVVPSYISRSVAGSYDLEAVAIFALVFVFYLYIKVRPLRPPAAARACCGKAEERGLRCPISVWSLLRSLNRTCAHLG